MNKYITKIAIFLIIAVAFVDGVLVAKHFLDKDDSVRAGERVNLEDIFPEKDKDIFTEKESEKINDAGRADDQAQSDESDKSDKSDDANIYSLEEVPFTTQAVHGWVPPWDKYAEETCIYMAMKWVKGEDIETPVETAETLLDIGGWENDVFGSSGDTPAALTIQILTSYYSHTRSYLIDEPAVEDIKNELKEGNLAALTINGALLGSEHYGDPAPSHHMILVIGFDDTKSSFIVNDPGTSHGEQIYYSYDKVRAAIKDSAIIIRPE